MTRHPTRDPWAHISDNHEEIERAREYGRRQGRGEIVSALLALADERSRAAGRAVLISEQEKAIADADWLTLLANEVRDGRL